MILKICLNFPATDLLNMLDLDKYGLEIMILTYLLHLDNI